METKKKGNSKYTADMPSRWLEAYARCHTMTHTCIALGISDQAYYTWRERYPEFKEATEKAKEKNLDFVESALYKRIESGDTAAIIFALKTIGRKRGFSERQEITGADGQPLVPNITFGGTLGEDEESKL